MGIKTKRGCIRDTNNNLVKKEDGNIYCGCGKSCFKLTMHIDGVDFYVNQYECTNCGNTIRVETKRSEAEK